MFIATGEGTYFEALVRRHGPMVLGVCLALLRNTHDAEDAFQATFLVLAQRAASIVPRECVGNWLYGVAYRTALQTRWAAARRKKRETQVKKIPDRWVDADRSLHELVNRRGIVAWSAAPGYRPCAVGGSGALQHRPRP